MEEANISDPDLLIEGFYRKFFLSKPILILDLKRTPLFDKPKVEVQSLSQIRCLGFHQTQIF